MGKTVVAILSCFLIELLLVAETSRAEQDVPSTIPAHPIRIESGRVQGVVEDELLVYRGIPFAAPPVGDLRWRAPRAVKSWKGVLEATAFLVARVRRIVPADPKHGGQVHRRRVT